MYVVLWKHSSLKSAAAIGTFRTRAEAEAWVSVNMMTSACNGNIEITAIFSPNVHSIAMPSATVEDEIKHLNQCKCCKLGYPIRDGIHHFDGLNYGRCTAEIYD